MWQDKQKLISKLVCNQTSEYNDFFKAYQKNISSFLTKLRISRKRQQYFKRVNKSVCQDNIYLRQEINRLEEQEDILRELLSDTTKKIWNLEDKHFKMNYAIQYRLKYSDFSGKEIFSNYYDSEIEALNNLENQELFVIEKTYKKINWCDYDSDTDYTDQK